MPYVRRKPYATSFKWPPTREDLDLIEVVEADTLSPVHARCDEPEPQPPEPPTLLKSVIPVRPVVRPDYELLPALTLPEPPEPQPLTVLVTSKPSLTLTRASWTWLTGHFDPNWLIASGAAFAVSLSAWMSLRAAPSVSPSDLDATLRAPSRPAAQLALPRFTPFTLGWSLPVPAAPKQATNTPAPTRKGRLQPPPPQTTAHEATARFASPAWQPQPQRAALTPKPAATASAAPLALNTRRSPFLSNVIASMPAASAAEVPTIRPAVDTHPAPASPSEHARIGRQGDVAESTVARNAVMPAAAVDARGAGASVGAPVQGSQQQVRAALKEYERAYEQLDAKAVRAVWPSVDTRALERAFHDLKSQTLVFDRCDIDVARGSQAVAACSGRATYETRAGQQAARSEPREWTFTLQKSDEAWRIVSASAR